MKYIIVIALLILLLLAVWLDRRYPPRYSSKEYKLGTIEGELTIDELVFESNATDLPIYVRWKDGIVGGHFELYDPNEKEPKEPMSYIEIDGTEVEIGICDKCPPITDGNLHICPGHEPNEPRYYHPLFDPRAYTCPKCYQGATGNLCPGHYESEPNEPEIKNRKD